jgi:hypothetical protein
MRARTRRLGHGRRASALAFGAALAALGALGNATPAGAEEHEGAGRAAAMDVVSVVPEPPPRPPPAPPLVITRPPFIRHVDVGGGVALVNRVASAETVTGATNVRYPAAVGFGIWARWDIVRYLRANLYALRSARDVDLPPGALGLPGDPGIVPMYTYSFGLKLAPTLPLGARARTWFAVGAGWGRLELGRFNVAAPGGSFQVRERSASFVELPFSLGTSFDLIPNWLTIELEATAALHVGQRGEALRDGAQAIDASGRRVSVGPFPEIAASFVQTLGLSLVL